MRHLRIKNFRLRADCRTIYSTGITCFAVQSLNVPTLGSTINMITVPCYTFVKELLYVNVYFVFAKFVNHT
jgi:hypothetical protein